MKRREFAFAAGAVALPSLIALPVNAQQAPVAPVAGKDYAKLGTRAPVQAPAGQVEVVEFFSYGCSHCKNFEPIFQAWKKAAPQDVAVRLVHVGFQSNFEPLQRIYYALETMGPAAVEKVHAKVFDALQTQHKRLDKPEVLFPWVADQGIDRAKFEEAYKSFGVANKVRQAIQLQDAYKVEGTPALGVAGRYYTDGSMAGGFDRMIAIVNGLIAQERKGG